MLQVAKRGNVIGQIFWQELHYENIQDFLKITMLYDFMNHAY
jgi:hypothetical protein